jgi:hypothetical protein
MLYIPALLSCICTVSEHLRAIQVSLDLHLLLIHHHERIHDHSKCHRCDYYKEQIKKIEREKGKEMKGNIGGNMWLTIEVDSVFLDFNVVAFTVGFLDLAFMICQVFF